MKENLQQIFIPDLTSDAIYVLTQSILAEIEGEERKIEAQATDNSTAETPAEETTSSQ